MDPREMTPGEMTPGEMTHRNSTGPGAALTAAVGAAVAAAVLLAGCGVPSNGTGGPTTSAGPATGQTTPARAPEGTTPEETTPGRTGGTATGAAPGAAPDTVPEEVRTVATGLEAPWSVAFTSDGTALVSQRDAGTVLELTDDGGTREVGTVEGIRHGGEGGLLGLTVDDQDRLYAYSTGTGGNRIQRFPLLGSRGSLGLGAAETVLGGLPAARNHNGGRISFGPDGMLYVSAGDAGEPSSAQDLDSLGGKVLRLTPDGGIPADNPFPGSPVYSYGHRNVQGLAWSGDGTLFATEFGQNTWDELNVIEPGGNYGWPEVEGIAGSGTGTGTGGQGYLDPVQQWRPAEASPSGLAARDGTLYIANLRGEVLRTVPVDDPGSSAEHWAGEHGRLRDVVVAPDGAVWVLTNNTDGRGDPADGDDRILAFTPGGSGG